MSGIWAWLTGQTAPKKHRSPQVRLMLSTQCFSYAADPRITDEMRDYWQRRGMDWLDPDFYPPENEPELGEGVTASPKPAKEGA